MALMSCSRTSLSSAPVSSKLSPENGTNYTEEGREGRREGGREGGRVGGRVGGKEGEGGREGGKEREGERVGGREGGREGRRGKISLLNHTPAVFCYIVSNHNTEDSQWSTVNRVYCTMSYN